MSKITVEAFNSECRRWRLDEDKTERLGQRLMNAFSTGRGPDSDIFYKRDHSEAARLFYDRYVK